MIDKEEILLGDVLIIECNEEMKDRIRKIPLIRMEKYQQRAVFSIMNIIAKIRVLYPDAMIESIGETDFIITRKKEDSGQGIMKIIKTLFIAAIVFWGGAFSIMTYHNDVGITDTFVQLYQIFSGSEKQSGVLEWAYSIGIGLGILIFYHHFSKKNMEKDPTPMEVELNKYENDLDMSIVENYNRTNQNHD